MNTSNTSSSKSTLTNFSTSCRANTNIHTLASKVSPHRRLSPATHLPAKVKGRDTGIGGLGCMNDMGLGSSRMRRHSALPCKHALQPCQPWKWEGLLSAIWIFLAAVVSMVSSSTHYCILLLIHPLLLCVTPLATVPYPRYLLASDSVCTTIVYTILQTPVSRLLYFALTPLEGIPARILYSDNHRLSLSYLQLQQLSHLSPQRDSTTTWYTIPAIHLYPIALPHTTTNMSPKPSPSIPTLLATLLLLTTPTLAQTTYVQGTFQAAISASSNGQPDLTSAASAVCPANFPQSCSSIGEAGLYVWSTTPNPPRTSN
jgi:hypothetical protein